MTLSQYDADVIIVGGGISGLTAATNFHKQGISYLILEATNRIGGRLKSHNFNGTVVEAGANWITGPDDKNPIYDIGVNELGLEGVNELNSWIWFKDCITGTDQTDAGNQELEVFESYQERLNNLNLTPETDISVRDALTKVGWKKPTGGLASAAEWLYWEWVESVSPETASFYWTHQWDQTDTLYNDQDYLVTDQRGFDLIAKTMANNLDQKSIKTETKVNIIKTGNNKVEVVTDKGSFSGQHVIVTASLGVLKSGMITFDPPLPQWKVDAIQARAWTYYAKVFLTWDEKWWSLKDFGPSNSDTTSWVTFMDEGEANSTWRVMSPVRGSIPMLMFHSEGDEAKRIEDLSDEEIMNEVTSKLRRAFPKKTINPPSTIFFNRWGKDPFFQGTYSSQSVGFNSLKELLKPVQAAGKGSIFFAGEAFSSKTQGYLHSAAESGQETALKVMQSLGVIIAIARYFQINMNSIAIALLMLSY